MSTQQAIELVALASSARHEPRTLKYLNENDGTFADFRTALAGTSFLERFDRFLDLYGHRGRYESDWSLPRLHENPTPALFAIQQQLQERPQDLKAVAERQEADAAGAWRAFESRLTLWQRWTVAPRVRAMLKRLKNQYVWREQVRSDLTRILRYARAYHLTLAMRFVERGWLERPSDYFLLPLDEVGRAIDSPAHGPALRAIAARSAAKLAAERRLTMPMLMRERDLPALLRAGRTEADSQRRADRPVRQPRHGGGRGRRHARPGRVRLDEARRNPGRAGDRPVVDAAVHDCVGRYRRGRRDAVARLDHRARVRAPGAGQRQECDAHIEDRRPDHPGRDGRAGDTRVGQPFRARAGGGRYKRSKRQTETFGRAEGPRIMSDTRARLVWRPESWGGLRGRSKGARDVACVDGACLQCPPRLVDSGGSGRFAPRR